MRDYHGYSFDFDKVAKELFRVTKNGGIVVWIVSDRTITGSETGRSFKQALTFIDCGFRLMDTMIFKKPPKGASGNNRLYWQEFEYMFVFSKVSPNTVN
jgi:site-specific DNA-methyltransferase (adenine-specific)